jgi:DNA-binding transcriptional LysR family regulator
MPVNLPTELLRSFAAIVDSGSMLKATERVFVTQSALSLQMKRLECRAACKRDPLSGVIGA